MTWQPKHLTREQQAERRAEAQRLLSAGWRPAAVARELSVSRAAVSKWKKRFAEEGEAALKARHSPGRPPKLSAEQQTDLLTVLSEGALAAGFPTKRWTRQRITVLIQQRYGVKCHPSTVGRMLHRLGWSVQKPEVRAIERDEAAIARWRQETWPRIKKTPAPKRRKSCLQTKPATDTAKE